MKTAVIIILITGLLQVVVALALKLKSSNK